jgi:hypothetical protein
MAIPMTKTVQTDTDANVLANLQTLGTSIAITAYSSTSGKQVTWADTPSAWDVEAVLFFFQTNLDMVLA